MRKRILFVMLAGLISMLCMTTSLASTTIYGMSDKLTNTGEMVVRIQTRLRDLGYFLFKSTGRFQSMTAQATIEFQKLQTDENNQGIMADGTVGEQSITILFGTRAVRANILPEVHIPIGANANGTQTKVGNLVGWETVKEKLTIGQTYTLMDFNTGTVFRMTYTGGTNHAEMECASASDTEGYKETFGGEYNYSKRPMLLELDGEHIACSLQGEPHGEDKVSGNAMTGHACLFFEGSASHVGMLQDVEHLNQIYKAAGRT